MGAPSQSLPAPALASHERALGHQLVNWLVMLLLALNIAYSGFVLFVLTPDPGYAAALGCTGRYLPSDACYWLKGLPAPGIGAAGSLFLPVDTPQATLGLGFGLLMLALIVASGAGLARGARWRNWAVVLTMLLAVAGWSLWGAIPLSFAALGQILSLLFVASVVVLSAVGIYLLGAGRPRARNFLVLVGAYAVLVGAVWVAQPVALLQVVLGVLLILLLLERQGQQVPSLKSRISSWTVIPLLLVISLVATHRAFIAPAEGIAAFTLNWQTISQRTLEHTRIVLMASLIAIATAVPLGILITRDHKFALRTRRIFQVATPIILIALGYLLPGLLAWWMQEPAFLEERGLLRALSVPLLVALVVGAAIHWWIRRRMRQRRDWGSVDSWRSLAPVAINVANVGQTVPSLAVLGLSMSFLGIGFLPAIVALWVRALLPILQNTVAGILAVDADIIEAAHGMGMTRRQVLFRIELPLAMAVIFAGIRTAVVFNVAVGALAFYIGAGGLGHLIAIGIGLSNARILITGGILTALMAIAADFVMGHIQERLVPPTV
jgi:osmoprotectant transport system permease protein